MILFNIKSPPSFVWMTAVDMWERRSEATMPAYTCRRFHLPPTTRHQSQTIYPPLQPDNQPGSTAHGNSTSQ